MRVLRFLGLFLRARGVDIADRRAGFKVFDVCNNAYPLFFVRVPRILMLVYCVFIVFRAGSKVLDAGKTKYHRYKCGFKGIGK